MKLTHYGRREWLGQAMIALILICILIWLAFFGILSWSVFPIPVSFIFICWLAVAAFFRDPVRKIPSDPGLLVSPADGVVRDVELIPGEMIESEDLRNLFRNHDVLRIGIFLSVLNVHVNRAPAAMKVLFRTYKQGAFHDARDGRAIRENEAMTLGATVTEGVSMPIAVKQISGAIARRIVCPVEKDAVFARGELYGMIKFGSRTELYVPAGIGLDVMVEVGQPVRGGETVLVRIPQTASEKLRQWDEEQVSAVNSEIII